MPSLPLKHLAAACLLGALVALGGCSNETSTDEVIELDGGVEVAAWERAPVVPQIEGEVLAELVDAVEAADEAGNRPGVFAKIGDSNTDFTANLHGLGCRRVDLGNYGELEPILGRFTATRLPELETIPGCRPPNSFSRDSVAAVVGAWVDWVLTPIGEIRDETHFPVAAEDHCPQDLSVTDCELRLLRPRYATIMIGSNDVYQNLELGDELRSSLEELIETVRDHDVVPVLSTVAPMADQIEGAKERIAETNAIIAEIARDESIPLINVWRAMTEPQMVNNGIWRDGVHLNVYGGGHPNDPQTLRSSAILTDEATRYGANRRNLIWLQTLDRLERAVTREG